MDHFRRKVESRFNKVASSIKTLAKAAAVNISSVTNSSSRQQLNSGGTSGNTGSGSGSGASIPVSSPISSSGSVHGSELYLDSFPASKDNLGTSYSTGYNVLKENKDNLGISANGPSSPLSINTTNLSNTNDGFTIPLTPTPPSPRASVRRKTESGDDNTATTTFSSSEASRPLEPKLVGRIKSDNVTELVELQNVYLAHWVELLEKENMVLEKMLTYEAANPESQVTLERTVALML